MIRKIHDFIEEMVRKLCDLDALESRVQDQANAGRIIYRFEGFHYQYHVSYIPNPSSSSTILVFTSGHSLSNALPASFKKPLNES